MCVRVCVHMHMCVLVQGSNRFVGALSWLLQGSRYIVVYTDVVVFVVLQLMCCKLKLLCFKEYCVNWKARKSHNGSSMYVCFQLPPIKRYGFLQVVYH